jgi:hypothetical protein
MVCPYVRNFIINQSLHDLKRLGLHCHLDVGPVERSRVYYKGEGGGFPQVRAVVSLVCPVLLVACPSTKGAPTMH